MRTNEDIVPIQRNEDDSIVLNTVDGIAPEIFDKRAGTWNTSLDRSTTRQNNINTGSETR